MAQAPLISIVIPVKNGAPWLQKTLGAIFQQTLISRTEVIVIDSGSTDETLKILEAFPVRLISISPHEFNHGETRNLGVRAAKGKYVVMTVQDAEAVDTDWLENLLSGFDTDKVAGVCGQQVVPHDIGKNPIEWFRPVSEPRVHKFVLDNAQHFDSLTPQDKLKMCSWDNVNAMYHRAILLAIPFQRVSFAEDALWAKSALENCYEIVYNPKAQVSHYHYETPDFIYRRAFTVHYHFYKFFGVRPELTANGVARLLRDLRTLLMERHIKWKDKVKWLWFNYQKRSALNRAAEIFLQTLADGPQNLYGKHVEICRTAPQAPGPLDNLSQIYAK